MFELSSFQINWHVGTEWKIAKEYKLSKTVSEISYDDGSRDRIHQGNCV